MKQTLLAALIVLGPAGLFAADAVKPPVPAAPATSHGAAGMATLIRAQLSDRAPTGANMAAVLSSLSASPALSAQEAAQRAVLARALAQHEARAQVESYLLLRGGPEALPAVATLQEWASAVTAHPATSKQFSGLLTGLEERVAQAPKGMTDLSLLGLFDGMTTGYAIDAPPVVWVAKTQPSPLPSLLQRPPLQEYELDPFYRSDNGTQMTGVPKPSLKPKDGAEMEEFKANIQARLLSKISKGDMLHGTSLKALRSIFITGRMDSALADFATEKEIYASRLSDKDLKDYSEGEYYPWNVEYLDSAAWAAKRDDSVPVVLRLRSTSSSPIKANERTVGNARVMFSPGEVKTENIEVFVPQKKVWVPLSEWAAALHWSQPVRS